MRATLPRPEGGAAEDLIDVTSHGFIVEVARLDKDAGWCYDLDLTWMAYGFADMPPG